MEDESASSERVTHRPFEGRERYGDVGGAIFDSEHNTGGGVDVTPDARNDEAVPLDGEPSRREAHIE